MNKMFKEVKVSKEVIEHKKFCGVCGVEITMGLACSAASCQICRNDLCEKCIGTEKSTFGDYREVWCINCWTIGEKYRPAIKELDDKCKKLYGGWYAECKEHDLNE